MVSSSTASEALASSIKPNQSPGQPVQSAQEIGFNARCISRVEPMQEQDQASSSKKITCLVAQWRTLSTASLMDKLQDIAPQKPICDEKQLFERLKTSILHKKMKLISKVNKMPSLSLTPYILLGTFGSKFKVKGSAVDRLVPQHRARIKDKVEFEGLNDLDIAIQVKKFDAKNVRERLRNALLRVVKEALLSQSNREPLSEQTEQTLLDIYVHDMVETEQFIKFRLHTDRATLPIDVVIYNSLDAQFDTLKTSTEIHVDTNEQTAHVHQLLNDKSLEFISDNHLLWLNESMSGGLVRVQKNLTKWPDAKLLQPHSVVALLYDKSTPVQKAQFILWFLLQFQPTSDKLLSRPFFLDYLKNLHRQWQNNELDAAYLSEKDRQQLDIVFCNLPVAKSNDEYSGYAAKLLQCLHVFPDFRKAMMTVLPQMISKDAEILEELSQVIENPFARLDSKIIIQYLAGDEVVKNPQLRLLLFPLLCDAYDTAHDSSEKNALGFLMVEHNKELEGTNVAFDIALQWLEQDANTKANGVISEMRVFKEVAWHLQQLLPDADAVKAQTSDALSEQFWSCMERVVPHLSGKNLKVLEPLLGQVPVDKIKNFNITALKYPRAATLFAYLDLKRTLLSKSFLINSTEKQQVEQMLDYGASTLQRTSLLKTCIEEKYIQRGGVFQQSNGFWLECSGQYLVVSPQENILYFGSAQKKKKSELQAHGQGVQFRKGYASLIIGEFKNNAIQDKNAVIATREFFFKGGVYKEGVQEEKLIGLGELRLHSSNPVLEHWTSELDRFSEAPGRFIIPASQPLADSQAATLSGNWDVSLDQFIANPILSLGNGQFALNTSLHSSAQNSMSVRIKLESHQVKSGVLLNQFGRKGLMTVSPETGYANPQDLKFDNNSVKVMLVSSEVASRSIPVTLEARWCEAKRTFIQGTVQHPNYTFTGGVENFQPQGKGYLKLKGEPSGRWVEMDKGQVFDQALTDFSKSPKKLRLDFPLIPAGASNFLSLAPYSFPDPKKARFLSFQNKVGRKFTGYQSGNLLFGILQGGKPGQPQLKGGFMWANQAKSLFFSSATSPSLHTHWVEQTRIFDKFRTEQALEHDLLPHGHIEIKDTVNQKIEKRLFAFGVMMPPVDNVLNISSENLSFFRSKVEKDQFFILKDNLTFSNLKIKDKSLVNLPFATIFEQFNLELYGSCVFSYGYYTGDTVFTLPHGLGKLIYDTGSVQQGRFKQSLLAEGQVIFENGVIIQGSWDMGIIKGAVEITIPILNGRPQKLTGTLEGARLTSELVSPDGKLAFPKGNLQQHLKFFNKEILPLDLSLLDARQGKVNQGQRVAR